MKKIDKLLCDLHTIDDNSIRRSLLSHRIYNLLMIALLQVVSPLLWAGKHPEVALSESPTHRTLSPTTITLKGTIDPRLYAVAYTIYVASTSPYKEACLSQQKDWGTGQRKMKPAFTFAVLVPDANHHYEVTLPVEYTGESACDYVYFATEIKIRRDKDDDLWAKFTIQGGKENHIQSGTATGSMEGVQGVPIMSRQTKRYFRFPSPTDIRCFTTHYQTIGRGDRKKPDHIRFACYEEYTGINGMNDKYVTTTITLNIGIDGPRNIYIRDDAPDGNHKVPHHFVDYQAPLTFWQKLSRYFQQLFHSSKKYNVFSQGETP
ncbi:hypothetical protein AB835_00750 [Candidatus Endobugula sertula]|uniref:Uncharacterized protein n=1 Tax=Candidatus Endobugula sertula TaxID=62101 RepID=A0A1D2QU08_9GAMM|nr:hypothetical protein AB835_00750 [Candidatus Endobugula sertula]